MSRVDREPAPAGKGSASGRKKDIAIVGAGVAGSRLACLLAGRGFEVTLFDPRPAWEKPCGGGLSDKLVTEFGDVVRDLPEVRNNFALEVVFSPRRRASMTMERPLVTVSRRLLGESLLDKAVKAGACLRKEKVLSLTPEAEQTVLHTVGGAYRAGLVVGADGVNSLVRRTFLRPFPKAELWFTHGALLPVEVNLPIVVRFFYGCRGYAWIFPRKGRTSVGIISRTSDGLTRNQRVARLREFVSGEFARAGLSPPDVGRTDAWLLPSLRTQAFADNVVAGPGWALIGDASGSADPLTGEGIYYALKTAHLLAESLIQGRLQAYETAWKAMASVSVAKVGKKLDTFYHPATLRMVGFLLEYSPSVRALTRDIVCGSQKYDSLKQRVKSELPAYVKEALFNLIASRKGERQGG